MVLSYVLNMFNCRSGIIIFVVILLIIFILFFKQKTAYEMRISDWSSDVCSSDLAHVFTFSSGEKGNAPCFDCSQVARAFKIGRASCRDRVCQYVSISVVAVSLQNKKKVKLCITMMICNLTI